MSDEEPPYAPPAGLPEEDEDLGDPDADRLPPPIFAPGTTRREVHRAPIRPPSLPAEALYGPDDPPKERRALSGREAELATLLESLADELRRTGTVRFGADDRIEAALRGFLSGILVD